MIGWFVAALFALVAVWALSRASYWKWMWEGERSLNQVLMGASRTREPRSTGLWVDGIQDDTEGLPRIDTRKAS
jgi:hypothetical protein